MPYDEKGAPPLAGHAVSVMTGLKIVAGPRPACRAVADEVRIDRAGTGDVAAIAALFQEAFRDSVLHYCGRIPETTAMEDIFSFVRETEPEAALVARSTVSGSVIGYCFAPSRLSRLWKRAVVSGRLFVWAWRWLTGQYGFGLQPLKTIALNKIAFFHSALTPSQAADARILSVAVQSAWRGCGVAGALLQEAEVYFRSRQVRRVRLEVRPDNAAAVHVYRKVGFSDGGMTHDSQGPWLIMFKEME